MRQLLATIILGGALAVTAAAAFAETNSADQNVAPFAPVVLQNTTDSASMSGAYTQEPYLTQYRGENIGR
ncbi:MAG TPA: hypothetical protein VFW01_00760 [bacterium]|nr:hypothetical protein [bacterium]